MDIICIRKCVLVCRVCFSGERVARHSEAHNRFPVEVEDAAEAEVADLHLGADA